MPIYEYVSEDPDSPEHSCGVCRRGFELRHSIDRAPLVACPICKRPVRKVISKVSSPRVAKPLSVADAKQAGFTVMERRDKGVYEKL